MHQLKICIIILNWNNLNDTVESLNSIDASRVKPQTVVFCDNASTDGSQGQIIKWAQEKYPPESIVSLSDTKAFDLQINHPAFVFIEKLIQSHSTNPRFRL